MSTAAKRRIVLIALLVVFALWPLVQHALVQSYGLNPWKFFGFAMYTQPRIIPIVDVYVLDKGGRHRPLLRPDELRAVEAFQLRREVWGELAAPDELARVLRGRVGGAADIEIVVTSPKLDATSARITSDRTSYFFEAGGDPAGTRL